MDIEIIKKAVLEGFKLSSEGFNGEFPFDDDESSDEEIAKAIAADEVARSILEEYS